jgi:hypothetical protein
MSPIEYVVYTGTDDKGTIKDYEVFEGSERQLAQLEQDLVESWKGIAGINITIVYKGPNLEAAKEAIAGLPKVSDEGV